MFGLRTWRKKKIKGQWDISSLFFYFPDKVVLFSKYFIIRVKFKFLLTCNKYNLKINTNEKNRNFLKKFKIRKLLWNTRKNKFFYNKIYILLSWKKDWSQKMLFWCFLLNLSLII